MMPPQLVVFDLDFTLWDCDGTWCDCLSPPFEIRSGMVLDSRNRHVSLYPDIHEILNECELQKWNTALASRTERPAWARQLIELLGIAQRFSYSEIYPSSKLEHFAALREATKIEYQQMLFFDDEQRNINEVSSLGVCCIHVTQGLNHQLFRQGLDRIEQHN
jgi:magnesium-dependent phosphatase 1